MKECFVKPWSTRAEVPNTAKDGMWEKFIEKYDVDNPEQLPQVRQVWNHILGNRFSDTLAKVRETACQKKGVSEMSECCKKTRPRWINEDVWNYLVDLWLSPECRQHSQAKCERQKTSKKRKAIVKPTEGLTSSINFNTQESYLALISQRQKEDVVGVDGMLKEEGTTSQPPFDPYIWAEAIGIHSKGRQFLDFGPTLDPSSGIESCSTGASHFSASNIRPADSSNEVMNKQVQDLQGQLDALIQEVFALIGHTPNHNIHLKVP